MKITWHMDPRPTGPYKSFIRRSWPHAEYPDGQYACMIFSAVDSMDNEYHPSIKETARLKIRVYCYRGEQRTQHIIKGEFIGLRACKERMAQFLIDLPDWAPKQ